MNVLVDELYKLDILRSVVVLFEFPRRRMISFMDELVLAKYVSQLNFVVAFIVRLISLIKSLGNSEQVGDVFTKQKSFNEV